VPITKQLSLTVLHLHIV